MRAWNIQDAKAKFCQIIKEAESDPQEICKNGKPVAVIISIEEYNALKKPKKIKRLGDLLRSSGLVGLELEIDCSDKTYRDIDL
ncbi:MAG: type II toxin-antitoxin system Phd/YefM family antitoxin [Gammaproteobacteria bacterium]|nr:type II toxin-antitoxin system Phd/YefM family antitoxin [Gammaproteobacteria bacterium]